MSGKIPEILKISEILNDLMRDLPGEADIELTIENVTLEWSGVADTNTSHKNVSLIIKDCAIYGTK